MIITPGMKFIGEISNSAGKTKEQLHTEIVKGSMITVNEAIEVTANLVPVPAEGGRMALVREFGAMPIMTTLYGAPLHVYHVTAIQFFDEMKEGDVDGYKKLAKDAVQHSKGAISARSNIVMADRGKNA